MLLTKGGKIWLKRLRKFELLGIIRSTKRKTGTVRRQTINEIPMDAKSELR